MEASHVSQQVPEVIARSLLHVQFAGQIHFELHFVVASAFTVLKRGGAVCLDKREGVPSLAQRINELIVEFYFMDD